jgi:hypothetical protein
VGSPLGGAWERPRLLTESTASGPLIIGHSYDVVSTRLSAESRSLRSTIVPMSIDGPTEPDGQTDDVDSVRVTETTAHH